VVAALAAAPASSGSQAVATVECWKRLLNDWYDGRIDNAYPVRCYRDAIANLPDDVKVYADAEADIRRALLAALLENKKVTGAKATPATPVKPPSKPKPAPARGEEEAAPPVSGPGQGEPPFDGTLPTGATRSADAVPLPLIVLGALALLLLAAAGAGVVARRVQARRIPAGAPPTEEPPTVA
jgi:hypothetical protein